MRRQKPKPKKRRRTTAIAGVVAGVALLASAGIFLLTQGDRAGVVVPPANSVARIDSDTNAFDQSVSVGEDPTGITVGQDGDIWVINQGDETVNRIDPGTGEVTPAKSTLGIPTGVAAGEGAVWITNGFGSQSGTQVVRVDPIDDSVEIAFPSDNAKAIVVAFDSIWLADADRDRVLRYDPEDLSAEPIRIPVDHDEIADEAPRSLAVGIGAAEGVWVVNELGETVVRIDHETNEVASTFQVDAPTAVAADDSGIWVTSETLDRVHHLAIDGRTLRSYQSADGVPDGPTAIGLSSSGVWVGSDLDTAFARIDPETGTIDRLQLGGITGGIAVHGNGDVWVTVRTRPA